MEQAFSKVTAMLTAAVMLFVVPVVINLQRQENLIQLSVMQDTVQFVDAVRNVGAITEETFKRYENSIRRLQGGLEINMVHTTESLYIGGGNVEHTSVVKTEDEILKQLENAGVYQFQKGDYFRVEVKKTLSGYSRLIYGGYLSESQTNETVYAYYGGSVRYED